jgi:hypothetical protein
MEAVMCKPILIDPDEDPGVIRAELARLRRQAQLAASQILDDQGRDDVQVLRPVERPWATGLALNRTPYR